MFEGTSDFEACYNFVKPSLLLPTEDEPCYDGEWPNKECRIGNRYFPAIPDDMKFIGVSSVAYLRSFLKPLMDKAGILEPWSMKNWKEGSEQICKMDYESIVKYNDENNLYMQEKYLGNYCMLSVYLYVLFAIGLGFPEDSHKVYAVDKLDGHDFDIGFGYVLEQANDLPWKIDDHKQWEHTTESFAALAWSALLFGFFGSVGGGCVLIACRLRIEACLDSRDHRKQRLLYRASAHPRESICEGLEMGSLSSRPSLPSTPGGAAEAMGDWPKSHY